MQHFPFPYELIFNSFTSFSLQSSNKTRRFTQPRVTFPFLLLHDSFNIHPPISLFYHSCREFSHRIISNRFSSIFFLSFQTMANSKSLFLSLFILTFSLHVTANSSPSPSPAPANTPSHSLSPSNHPPASSPPVSSPPVPSPLSPTPISTPAPSPEDSTSLNHIDVDEKTEDSSTEGGMSGSKKAGIAIGIIVAASVLMLAAMVYKKRQQNLQRNQYNYG